MKRYVIFFSKPEAFLKFQYVCEKISISTITSSIVITQYGKKELVLVLLKKNNFNNVYSWIKKILENSDEVFAINFKNKLLIDIEYLDIFKIIQKKSHEYYENKLLSCNHQRLELSIKSMLDGFTLEVARKNLDFEIEMSEHKKANFEYFNSVINVLNLSISDKLIYDVLYIIYSLNNTQNQFTKPIFYAKKFSDNFENALNYYKKIMDVLKDLYLKEIITYPFEDECEIMNENKILQEEKYLIEKIISEPSKINIFEKNAILFSDIAYMYHVENEDFISETFCNALDFCIEKNLLYFLEGKLYLTKNGEKLYDSILQKELEQYLHKGF